MLRLNLNEENERELANGLLTAEQREILPEFEVAQLGTDWTNAALAHDLMRLVDWERSHRQSVGSFVIVQSGTPEERDAWDAALEATRAPILESARLSVEGELRHRKDEAEEAV